MNMKKSLLFVTVMSLSIAINAQTIVIDGSNADWAEVPMLNEPGVTPVFKMIVPQEGLTLPEDAAICVMVERTEAEKTTYPGAPVTYVDADKDVSTTEAADAWYCPSFGPDYEMGAWDGNSGAASEDGTMDEVLIVKSKFEGIPFAGDCYAWLLFNWAKLLPNSPLENEWKWDEGTYHPIYARPFAFADLNGTHSAATVYSSHEALTIGSAINMHLSGANDTLLWVSWAVELKESAKFDIKANISSSNAASVDLKLVSTATNKIVAEYKSVDLAAGADVTIGEWDLTAVPAGKYMLKFSNHVQWSEMILNSLTLAAQGEQSGVETTTSNKKVVKFIRNGQVFFIRDGKTFNALGAEVR